METYQTERSAVSRSNRILLILSGTALSFILIGMFFVEIFFFIETPIILGFFAFITTLVLGIVLSRFSYRRNGTPFKILVLWFLLMGFGFPLLAQPYYRAVAAQLVLSNVPSKAVNVVYTPYQGIKSGGPYVTYAYRTDSQEQDYLNMKELYKIKFANKQKWGIADGIDGDKTFTVFNKINGGSPRVTLVIDEKTPDLIEVGISF